MRYALGLVGLVVVGLVVTTSSAVPRSLTRVASPAGAFDVRLGPRVSVDGGVWVVRSWRRRARGSYPPANEDCLQVGQESGARLVRLVAGRKRTMALRDRSVCGSTAFRANEPIDPATAPLLVERLVDAAPGRPMEFGNTVVAGILPATVRGVELSARGRRVRVTISHDSRAFLAILAGSVRRQDLALTFERSTARQTVDLGTGATGAGGDSRMVARSNDDPDRDP